MQWAKKKEKAKQKPGPESASDNLKTEQ